MSLRLFLEKYYIIGCLFVQAENVLNSYHAEKIVKYKYNTIVFRIVQMLF